MIDETFTIEDDALIRRVVPRRGAPYEHACTEQVYKDAAYAIEQLGAAEFSGAMIAEQIDAPYTQVMTAILFLRKRGCTRRAPERRHRAAGDFVYEDALIEWHTLREGAPGSR